MGIITIASMFSQQVNKFIRAELEFAKRVAQGGFVQCVAGMRLVKGDQVWAVRGAEELPQ